DNVKNFWAIRGDEGPMVCFAGHTDVVPPGSGYAWLLEISRTKLKFFGRYLNGFTDNNIFLQNKIWSE
ncbi:MAG: hypothetical protein CBC09_09310, partial [Cellvibrionales bacterium TMED49]